MIFSGTGSSPDHHYRIRFCTFLLRAGWSSIDPNRIRFCTDRDHVRHFYSGPDGHRSIRIGSVFVHLARFRYRCVIPDPLGLNEARSDPPPAKQIGTTSRICIPGRMVTDQSEKDPFFTSGPVPISMRYPSKYEQC